MGCDIHMHSEIKVNGKWLHYDQPECDRNYDLFEKMAGVRGDDKEAIALPRGLPADITETTRFDSDHWNGDGHSHSWLSASEIAQLRSWWEAQVGSQVEAKWDRWLFGNYYSGFLKYRDDVPTGVEDVRFIFWFDN